MKIVSDIAIFGALFTHVLLLLNRSKKYLNYWIFNVLEIIYIFLLERNYPILPYKIR